MIGDRGDETEDEIAVTRDPVDDKPAVMTVVSVAMPLLADCALATADFSFRLELDMMEKEKMKRLKWQAR